MLLFESFRKLIAFVGPINASNKRENYLFGYSPENQPAIRATFEKCGGNMFIFSFAREANILEISRYVDDIFPLYGGLWFGFSYQIYGPCLTLARRFPLSSVMLTSRSYVSAPEGCVELP